MAEPAVRTRIRVRFPDRTVTELDRDPARSIGDLLSASEIGAYWAAHAKYLVRAKRVVAASATEPPEVSYEVEPLGAVPADPCAAAPERERPA